MQDQKVNVGDTIKKLRLDRGMSVEEVAEASGMTTMEINNIEELSVTPHLGNIITLAKVLRATVGDLFGDSADSPFCIVRNDARKKVDRFSSDRKNTGGYYYESLGYQKQNRQMEPFLVTLLPDQEAKLEPNQHVGEEIIFVLEGEVKVRLDDYTDILKEGDSIYYDSTLPHVVTCNSKDPARILAVIYAKKDFVIL